ncbi:MAG: hypothetical protein NDJ92_20260 [Thermoanaerobaculia bacterium]|nr:hypothetical protein [Thermoanaerobaculia bacterium]
MNKFLLPFLVVFFGCSTSSPFECPNVGKLEASALPHAFHDEQGHLIATGKSRSRDWRIDDRLPDFQNLIPVGRWEYWYPSGKLKAHVSYGLSCFLQCCTGGLCPQVHAYPRGAFELWFESGRRRATGTFVAERRHVSTSCEGGDFTMRATLSGDSKAWDESGEPITLDATALVEELLPGSP